MKIIIKCKWHHGVLKEEERQETGMKRHEQVMVQNFPKLIKESNSQIHKTYQSLYKIYFLMSFSHVIVKMLKPRNKQKIFKTDREKKRLLLSSKNQQ